MKKWIEAARLRTLPLALCIPLMGTAMAYETGEFAWDTFILSLITTLCLQVLSNFANDLGDSQTGVDNVHRKGPKRSVQSGEVSASAMTRVVILFSILSFFSGILLILMSLDMQPLKMTAFLFLGIAAILSAIMYTNGKIPYGYIGLGDLFVLVFFGWVGVGGVYYLYGGTMTIPAMLPSTGFGLLCVAVLNVNNIRDLESDLKAGKNSFAGLLGLKNAKIYHLFLIILGLGAMAAYPAMLDLSIYHYGFLISFPLFAINIKAVFTEEDPLQLDPYLKQLALSILVASVLFCIPLFFL